MFCVISSSNKTAMCTASSGPSPSLEGLVIEGGGGRVGPLLTLTNDCGRLHPPAEGEGPLTPSTNQLLIPARRHRKSTLMATPGGKDATSFLDAGKHVINPCSPIGPPVTRDGFEGRDWSSCCVVSHADLVSPILAN